MFDTRDIENAYQLDGYRLQAAILDANRLALTVIDAGTEETVAEAVFNATSEATGHVEEIWVSPGRRRRGIATSLYDAMERRFDVVPSDQLDEDGALFWDARRQRSVPCCGSGKNALAVRGTP